MTKFTKTGLIFLSTLLACFVSIAQPVCAQQKRTLPPQYAARRTTIAYGNSSYKTTGRQALSYSYGSRPLLSATSTSQLSYQNANFAGTRNGLPPVRLDSFVLNAGGHAEHIYGDEGADGLPPYNGFNHVHRINTGIIGDRDQGLTTGHGSYMPEAYGADEFLAPPGEWSQAGANNGNHQYNGAADGLDAADEANGPSSGGNGQPSAAELAAHPSPGEGYQPMFQHGVFVGWYSPEEVALAQTDFPAALRSIMASDRFWGDAYSIKVEIGDLPWP